MFLGGTVFFNQASWGPAACHCAYTYTEICAEENSFLLTEFSTERSGSIAVLNPSFPQDTEPPLFPKRLPTKATPRSSSWCLSVFSELRLAMQTDPQPLWGRQLWVSESPLSRSSPSLRAWGALPDHSWQWCRGSSSRGSSQLVLPCAALSVCAQLSGQGRGGSPGSTCHAALGHRVPKAGAWKGTHPKVGPCPQGAGFQPCGAHIFQSHKSSQKQEPKKPRSQKSKRPKAKCASFSLSSV